MKDEDVLALARLAHAKTTAAYRQAAEARKLTARLVDELDHSDTEEDTDGDREARDRTAAA